ncbi:hypothetical protein F7725_013142, partial [Dissostichus mawsoni]
MDGVASHKLHSDTMAASLEQGGGGGGGEGGGVGGGGEVVVLRRCSRQREARARGRNLHSGIIIMSASWKQLCLQILLLLVSCRHINTKTPGPTPPPLIPIDQLPTDVRSVALKGESHTEKVELLNPVNLALECTWTGNQDKLANITGLWRKDGEEVKNSNQTVPMENDQYNLKRVFSIVNEEDLGSYTCEFGSKAKIDFVLADREVRDKPIVSYVGDFVVITCKMEETKPEPSTWYWYRANGTDKEQIIAAEEPLRYEIKNEERKTKLVVSSLVEADGGFFHEPLKPFVAIVIEVIVLVAIILLYEKSQSKKNSAAAENGTTDQTNTLTQGESNGPGESSSMRQRKVNVTTQKPGERLLLVHEELNQKLEDVVVQTHHLSVLHAVVQPQALGAPQEVLSGLLLASVSTERATKKEKNFPSVITAWDTKGLVTSSWFQKPRDLHLIGLLQPGHPVSVVAIRHQVELSVTVAGRV